MLLATAATPVAMGKSAPTYTSAGYRPKKVPHTFVAAKPPRPVVLQPSGNRPHVFVDSGGTAHIAFADPNGAGADVVRTCRLPRGGSACAAGAALSPDQPGPGNDPQTNQDFSGPFPLAVGNELLVVDARCCNHVATGGSSFTDDGVYLYTSEDAGATFTGPTAANPSAGLIGTQDPSGDAIVFGGAVPSIGLISSQQTGGTIFQGVPAGSFTTDTANLSLRPDQQDASDGRLGLDGTRPIAAFSDFAGTIAVREWTGNGSVNDASRWTTLRITGADQPRIAGGPAGIALLTEPDISNGPLSVRMIASGGGAAGRPQVLTKRLAQFPTLSADPVSGMFAAAWIDGSDDSVHARTSRDGRVWGPDQLVMRMPGRDLDELDVAATADGGGFVTLRDGKGAPTTYDGRIVAGQFGPTGPTGKRGLGLVAGGSGPPSGDQAGFVACSQIHFADIDIEATAGCFLRDPKNPSSGAGVAESAISLNGLQIVPDAGSRIFIDPHAHSIDTQGAVSVIAAGAGSNPVKLWHGPLDVKVPDGAAVGATLFDFPMDRFAANVEGFGISAQAKVILTKDGVRIPVDLEMPSYFGGITGHAELVVDAKSGLHLDSLDFNIADVDIGVVELKDANVHYMSEGDKWDGGATLVVPGPGVTVGAELHFAGGKFNGGDFKISEFPGILVFSDVWLSEIRIGFQLEPVVFTGGVTFGFQPIAPPDTFAIGVRGGFRIETGPPVVVQIVGSGSVFGIDLAHAFFRYSSDGSLRILADVSIGGSGLGISGALKFGIVGEAFGGSIDAKVCAFEICPQVTVAANQRGMAACLGPGGVSHDWDDAIYYIDIHWTDCVADDYGAPAGTRSVPRAGGPPARTFTVPAGASSFTVAVLGDGGTPQVSLLDPTGSPVAFGDPKDKAATAVNLPGTPQSNTTYIGLAHPAAGTYTLVRAAGSPAIAGLKVSQGYATPKVAARVGGKGRKRTLRYRVSGNAQGTTIAFVERGPAGDVPIGTAAVATGTLRFTSGKGPGGRRLILAQASRGGPPLVSLPVARYRVPPIPKPGRVGRLRAKRTGTRLTVRFKAARAARSYGVKVLLTDGRGLQRALTGAQHSLTIPNVARGDHARVTVTAIGADGRRGPSRTARVG